MSNNANDNDLYLNAFEFNANKTGKRRSSILKSVDLNYVSDVNRNEERRGSRRVSWAQTFQYKELHPDGTTIIMSQELKNKSSEDNNHTTQSACSSQTIQVITNEKSDQIVDKKSVSCEQNIIIASDFINKLKKANNSMNETIETSVNCQKRRQTNEDINENKSPKPKRAKKSNTKSLANYLVKHYKTDDEKDYETVFNTSVNKYGRELVPRDERPEITQLFNDENNGMDITRVTNSTQHFIQNNNTMSFTNNQLSVDMSFAESQPLEQSIDTNRTNCFTDDNMEITSNISSQTHQLLQSVSNESQTSISVHDFVVEDMSNQNMDLSMISPENQTLKSSVNMNSTESEVSNEEFKSDATQQFTDEDMDLTKASKNHNKDMSDINSIDSNKSESNSKKNMSFNKSKQFTNDEMEITCNKTESIVTDSDCSDNYEESVLHSDDSGLHTIHDTTRMSCDISLDTTTDDNSLVEKTLGDDSTNELHESVETLRRLSSKRSLTANYDLPNMQFSKSAITNEIQMALEESYLNVSHQYKPLSDIAEETTNYSQEMSMTAPVDCKLNTTTAIEVQSELIGEKEESIRCEPTSKLSVIRETFSEEQSVKVTTEITRVEEPKVIPSKIPHSLIRRSVLPTFQLPNNTFSMNNLEQNKKVCAPKLSMGWLAQTTAHMPYVSQKIERKSIQCTQTFLVADSYVPHINPSINKDNYEEKPEEIAVSSEINHDFNPPTSITRSAARNSLTARLELAKSVVKDTFGFGITEKLKQKRDEFEAKRRQSIANTFTPNSSNTVMASEARKTLNFNSAKIATDLFEAKDNSESLESMIIDEESNSESTVDKTRQSDYQLNETKDNSLSLKSETSDSIEMSSTSPTSLSVMESPDSCFVSSPQSIDATFNFSFNPLDTPSDNFNPFIHTDQSFHANSSFYNSTSPLQLSFMVRDDTLCILSDQLERQLNDIVIPSEEPQDLIPSMDQTIDGMFASLKKIDAKQNGLIYEILNEDKALISYLWGTFALEIRFNKTIDNSSYPIKEIASINMKSLVSAEEPLLMRQQDLILQFNECHKPLITIAHDLIISSFENEKNQILAKYKTSASLDQLISDISIKMLSARKLLTELRIISSTQICKLFPKQNDCYSLVVEILGLRNTFHLILPINPKSYPDEVIHPKFNIRKEDKHLYCLNEFTAALLMIDSRKFNYIQRLIRATKLFVRAKKKVMIDRQRKLKQKKEIENAKLSDE